MRDFCIISTKSADIFYSLEVFEKQFEILSGRKKLGQSRVVKNRLQNLCIKIQAREIGERKSLLFINKTKLFHIKISYI